MINALQQVVVPRIGVNPESIVNMPRAKRRYRRYAFGDVKFGNNIPDFCVSQFTFLLRDKYRV